MITTIRRMFSSKLGAALALLFVLFMGLAFALSDVNNSFGSGDGVASGNVARVGDRQISIADLRQRVTRAYDQQREQNPGLSLQQFVAGGGMDRLLTEMTDIFALQAYAEAHGINVDKLAVDAAIAQIPQFQGLSGNFDQATFEEVLRQSGTTERDARDDIRSRAIVRQLVAPFGSITAVPQGMALAYGSLLLEQRQGQATFIPASRFAPTTAPTNAVLQRYFTSQRARYTVPERRALTFAILDDGAVRTTPTVTDAEIAADYRANAAAYAASESRRFTQVIAGTRAVADRIVAATRGGQSLSAAATAAGLSAGPVAAASEATFAGNTNAAAARAAFAAARGAIIGPVQVPLGWAVLKVDVVDARTATALAVATPAIRTRLLERKRQEALTDLFNRVQDQLNSGASVAEVAGEYGLTPRTTPALLPDGSAPGDASFRPDPLMPALLGPAFQLNEGDPAQLVTLQDNRIFALVEVTRFVPAAPPALAGIRARVVADWQRSEGARQARVRARAIVTATESGTAFGAAVAAQGAGGQLQAIGGQRIDLTTRQGRIPPEIALLFSMAPGTAKTLELPNNAGWLVISLSRIVRGDASGNQRLLTNVQQQFRGALGNEYVAALVAAARAEVGVDIADATVAELRQQLAGAPPGN